MACNGHCSSWTEYYKDDGDKLLLDMAVYDTYDEFEDMYCIQYGSTPLHHAVKTNKIEILRILLLKGAEVDGYDTDQKTPLYYSLLSSNIEIVKLLLDNGAAPNGNFIENECEISYFARVCQSSNVEIVKLFLNHGYDANQIFTSDHWTCAKLSRPLHVAVMNNRLDVMKLLLSYHANVNDINEDGESPLYLACKENLEEAVELLLMNNALVNTCTKYDLTPLYETIRSRNIKIIELLLDYGAFLDPVICDPLHKVISKGCLNILEKLVNHGLDVKMQNTDSFYNRETTLLHTAIKTQRTEIIKLLLDNNAEHTIKDEKGRTPLHIAAAKGNLVIVTWLVQYDKIIQAPPECSTVNVIDMQGFTPLHLTCEKGSTICAQYLLNYGADINAENSKGETPLHLACQNCHYDVVNLLVKNKASINVSSEDKITPLHIAVREGDQNIVKLLLMNGANILLQDNHNQIPIELAIDMLDLRVVKLLLEYNPDINSMHYRKAFVAVLDFEKDFASDAINCFFQYEFTIKPKDEDITLIMYNAVRGGHVKLVEQLIDMGVDVNGYIMGETLLHSASKYRNVDVIELLIKHKADIYAKDHFGRIPIFYAVEHNEEKVVETFLLRGVDIKKYPELILCTSVMYNSDEVIKVLLKYGADINYCNNKGQNILHLIIELLTSSKFKMYYISTDSLLNTVNFLLQKGINVDAKTSLGWTALHMVVTVDDYFTEELIQILFFYKPNINCKNELGETPLRLSFKNNNFTAIRTLINYGASIDIEDNSGKTFVDLILALVAERRQITALTYVISGVTVIIQRNINFGDEIVKLFQNHVIKLRVANQYVSPKTIQLINEVDNNTSKNYESECRKELSTLKDMKINNYVTAYDALVNGLGEVHRYTKNLNIDSFCDSLEKSKRYPIYGSLLVNQLREATRFSYLDEAKKSLDIISKLGLPDACSERVFYYLENEDLKILSTIFLPSA